MTNFRKVIDFLIPLNGLDRRSIRWYLLLSVNPKAHYGFHFSLDFHFGMLVNASRLLAIEWR